MKHQQRLEKELQEFLARNRVKDIDTEIEKTGIQQFFSIRIEDEGQNSAPAEQDV